MTPQHTNELTQRLAELAAYYNVAAPNALAMKGWIDALSRCLHADILAVLTDWTGNNERMPTGARVARLCEQYAARRAARIKFATPPPPPVYHGNGHSAAYRAFLERRKHPQADARKNDWWKDKLAEARLGNPNLTPIEVAMAISAWLASGSPQEHAPPAAYLIFSDWRLSTHQEGRIEAPAVPETPPTGDEIPVP